MVQALSDRLSCTKGAASTEDGADESTTLDEGHGFSRAVNFLNTIRLQPLRYAFSGICKCKTYLKG
jgi:hypothetical protein